MKRAFLTASLMLAVFVVAAQAKPAPARSHHVVRDGKPCAKTYTVKMAERAANAVYAGTRRPTAQGLRTLTKIERCQRRWRARPFVRHYYSQQRALHDQRVSDSTPEGQWDASWYDDSGSTASGWHAYYGVAMCGSAGPCYSFGTKIKLFYGRRTVIAVVDDHGPYVGGRNIDLNQNTAAALGFGGIGQVGYRVEH